MNDIVLSLPYILIFAPLLLSIMFSLVHSKRLMGILATLSPMFLIFVALKILGAVKFGEKIFVKFATNINILGTEYVINKENMALVLGILITSSFSLINLNYETFFTRQVNLNFKKFFHATYFLSLFSIIGIFTTSNIYHLFLFIEIFNFSSINMLSAYISKEVNTDIYKFYTNNVFGSFILCIAIFYLSLYFNTSDIISIKQQISSINLSSNYFIVFILLLLIIGFVLTFLMFNIRSIESKKKMSFNVSTTNNIFMSASVGLYLIDYFLFDIFNIKMEKYVLYILYVILSSFVVYYSTLILFIKDNSVYNVFFNFVRINIYYCLLGIITQNSAISSNIMVLNILENCIINYPIYLISVYLGEVHHSTNYRLLDEKEYFLLKMFLIFLILFKICIPGTMSYYSARILTNFFGLSRNYLMLFVIYVNKIIAAAFLVKFFFFKGRKKFIVQTFEFKRGRLYQYKVSLVLSFLVIVIFMMVFWSPAMDWARGDWLATL